MKYILMALAALTIGFFWYRTDVMQAPNMSTAPLFGAFSPTGGGTYRLGQSVGTTDSTMRLSSFKEPVSNIPYTMTYLNSDIQYGTISPQSAISEFVSFTGITQNSDGSATLTGVARGLSRTPAGRGCVASTTLAQGHAGQSIFILSNSPCFYAEYTPLRTNATSSAVLIFGSTTPPRYDYVGLQSTGTYNATTSEFASIAYVNAIAIAGVANATQAVKGIVELATQTEAASSTLLGSTGAGVVYGSGIATDTPNAATRNTRLLMSDMTGFLKQGWLNLTQAFTFSTTTHYTANIGTLTATTTYSFPPTGMFNNVSYTWPTSQGVASTTLVNNGSGTLSWDSPGSKLYATSTHSRVHSNNTVFDTLFSTTTIPGNMLGTSNAIRITIPYIQYKHVDAGSGGGALTISLNYGSASAVCTAQFSTASAISSLVPMDIVATIGAGGVTNDEFCTLKIGVYANGQTQLASSAAGGGYYFVSNGETTIDDTVAQTVTITATWSAASSNNSIQNINGAIIERIY